jgi:hypothetical protein
VSQADPAKDRLPRGVTALPRSRGGRRFLASIRRGKGGQVHLGIYETPWLADLAYRTAARAVGRDLQPPAEVPRGEEPTAEQVRQITARVRQRLGLDPAPRPPEEVAPDADELLTLFEVTVVGFWREQAADDFGESPGVGLDAAARGLDAAAGLIFWCRSAGHPTSLEAMTRLLGRRVDAAFRRADVARAVLDDDGDDPRRVARWLVHPDAFPHGRARGFREEVRWLYPDLFEGEADADRGGVPGWAAVLGVGPPFGPEQIRTAYRARSREAHPDAGGSDAAFLRLRAAYEEALDYGASMGW